MSSRRVTAALQMMLLPLLLWLLPLRLTAQSVVGDGGPGPVKADYLTVEMVAAGPAIARGGRQTVGFVFAMADGWHLLWRNPGLAQLSPPKVEWTLPEGITAGPLQFPAPDRFALGKDVTYGYEDSVAYPVTIEAAPPTKRQRRRHERPGRVHLAATVQWTICKQTCVNGEARLGLDLKLVAAGTPVRHDGEQVGALGGALKHMPPPAPEGFRLQATSNGRDLYLTVTTGEQPADGEFTPWDAGVLADTLVQPIELLADGVRIQLHRAPELTAWPQRLHGLLRLSGDEIYEVDVPITPGPRPAMNPGTTGPVTTAKSFALLKAVGWAFVAGLLLNLMPSVLPLLLLRVVWLLRMQEGDRHMRSHGAAYALGMVVAGWMTAAVLQWMRIAGRQPVLPPRLPLGAVVLLWLVLAAMVWALGLGWARLRWSNRLQTRYERGVAAGALTAVAGAPFVGRFAHAAFDFVLARPSAEVLLVFTVLGLGLALPMLLLTLVLAGRRRRCGLPVRS